MDYILSQVFVCLAYLCLGLTYSNKDRDFILYIGLLAQVFNGTSYIFLNAWTGFGVTCVAVARNLLFMLQGSVEKLKKSKKFDYFTLATLLASSLVVTIFTYNTWLSLFSIATAITYTISVWQKNVKVYKVLGMFSSMFSIIYFAFISSWFGVALEFCMLVVAIVSMIVTVFKERKENKKFNQVLKIYHDFEKVEA